ncbi:MAG: hypothetical protein NTY90_03490 [Candidatus Micrarchaeota archaeon]|nr:hypothetical protein [Candidatus Micrarchaeota archaeon]
MSDLSNKTLAVLIGLVLAVSLVGTWVILNKVSVRVAGAFSTNAQGTVAGEVEATVSLGIVSNLINFSVVNVTDSKDSATDAVAGYRFFTLENNGTLDVNVSANASTYLWLSATPSAFDYQLYSADNESGSTVHLYSQAVPLNITALADSKIIGYLNYTDSKDTANVFIKIHVPADEPPGAKSSTITFTASQA